jgi:hypothetical protein
MEKTKDFFYTLIKMVEVQNFVRTKKIVKLDKYIALCDNFVEYLVLIALLETDCVNLIQIVEILCRYSLEHRNKDIHKVFELLCKSSKRQGFWKILVKYYFEDSSFLSGDFAEIKSRSRNLKDFIIIDVFERACICFSYNKCVVVALLCYLHMYFELEDNCQISIGLNLYASAREPVVMEPEIYKNQNDESLLAETCVFWMNLNNNIIKDKMIKEYKEIVQRLCCIDE